MIKFLRTENSTTYIFRTEFQNVKLSIYLIISNYKFEMT